MWLAEQPGGRQPVVFDPDLFTWEEVEILHARGQWGARARPGTGTFITTSVDAARVAGVLMGDSPAP